MTDSTSSLLHLFSFLSSTLPLSWFSRCSTSVWIYRCSVITSNKKPLSSLSSFPPPPLLFFSCPFFFFITSSFWCALKKPALCAHMKGKTHHRWDISGLWNIPCTYLRVPFLFFFLQHRIEYSSLNHIYLQRAQSTEERNLLAFDSYHSFFFFLNNSL